MRVFSHFSLPVSIIDVDYTADYTAFYSPHIDPSFSGFGCMNCINSSSCIPKVPYSNLTPLRIAHSPFNNRTRFLSFGWLSQGHHGGI